MSVASCPRDRRPDVAGGHRPGGGGGLLGEPSKAILAPFEVESRAAARATDAFVRPPRDPVSIDRVCIGCLPEAARSAMRNTREKRVPVAQHPRLLRCVARLTRSAKRLVLAGLSWPSFEGSEPVVLRGGFDRGRS